MHKKVKDIVGVTLSVGESGLVCGHVACGGQQ